MATISMASGIDGFIFPGIIEDPACTGGRVISCSPAFGPMLISRRFWQRFRRFTAKDLSDAEKFMKEFMLLAISVRFLAEVKGIFVISVRFLTILRRYFGWAQIPVPTAVPPMPRICSSAERFWMKISDLLMASAKDSNSWPREIGTASWVWVRPTLIVLRCFFAMSLREFSSFVMAWRRAGSERRTAILVAVGMTSLVDCPMLM